METTLYHYRAHITKVYDGDTCTVDIDLGLKIWTRDETVRLYGINAPEVRGVERPQGLLSRDFLRGKILDKDVIVETFQDEKGKYGRWLATIWLEEYGNWTNINKLLVDQGFAEYKDY